MGGKDNQKYCETIDVEQTPRIEATILKSEKVKLRLEVEGGNYNDNITNSPRGGNFEGGYALIWEIYLGLQ